MLWVGLRLPLPVAVTWDSRGCHDLSSMANESSVSAAELSLCVTDGDGDAPQRHVSFPTPATSCGEARAAPPRIRPPIVSTVIIPETASPGLAARCLSVCVEPCIESLPRSE